MRPSRDDIRNDNPTPNSTCPACQTTFIPVRRQRYCTPACRQAAWRTRHPSLAPEPSTTTATPPTTRRDNTVYQCPTATIATSAGSGATTATNPAPASVRAAHAPTATSPSPSPT
jgi:hypothetical protein